MGVFDDYLVDPELSLLDKTRIQAQVLVPVLIALRCELGKEKADAIVKEALRGWSKELFAAIGDNVDGSPRRKWAAMHSAMGEATEQDVTVKMRATTRKRSNSTLRIAGSPNSSARSASPSSAPC
jgi:hypothetical protein